MAVRCLLRPAFDVFTGYLLLDAWIANTDRHPHNWGVLRTPSKSLALDPASITGPLWPAVTAKRGG